MSMIDLVRKHFLSTTWAPNDGNGSVVPEERIEVPDDDDVVPNDPQDEEEGEPEPEDEEGADETTPEDAAPPQPERRGQRQFGELRSTNRQLAEQNAELTRKLAELDGRLSGIQQGQQQRQESPQEREARLSQLSDGERARYELHEYRQQDQWRYQQMRQENFENSDRIAFATLQQSSHLAKRFSSEVERMFDEQKRKGQPVDRATILRHIIGDRALSQEGKPKKRAAENRERQQARPVRAGSDVRPSRSRAASGSAADIEERFGDVPI